MSAVPLVESGLQVITRLIDRSSVQNLDKDLFFNGLENSDVVEIRGTVGSGISDLLNKLIAKCILPPQYNGLSMDVLLLNTENQFQISKLYKIMRTEVSDIKGPVNVDGIVKDLLNSLKIMNCYNHQQFLLTLNSLDNILLKYRRVGLIVIDSISAYYWQKKDESYNSYLLKLLKIATKVTVDFKVLVVYTKQFDFASKKQTFEWCEGKKVLRYEISLSMDESLKKRVCKVKSREEEKELFYELKDSVFTWTKVDRLNSCDGSRSK